MDTTIWIMLVVVAVIQVATMTMALFAGTLLDRKTDSTLFIGGVMSLVTMIFYLVYGTLRLTRLEKQNDDIEKPDGEILLFCIVESKLLMLECVVFGAITGLWFTLRFALHALDNVWLCYFVLFNLAACPVASAVFWTIDKETWRRRFRASVEKIKKTE